MIDKARTLLAVAIALVAVGCSEAPPDSEGNNDYERGYHAGYMRAVESMDECVQSADAGGLGDCLASYTVTLPGDVSESFREEIRNTGQLIESELVLRYR